MRQLPGIGPHTAGMPVTNPLQVNSASHRSPEATVPAEDAHNIEVVSRSDKAKSNVEPRVMPLAINTFFDDEIPLVNYVNDTVVSVSSLKNNSWHLFTPSIMGGVVILLTVLLTFTAFFLSHRPPPELQIYEINLPSGGSVGDRKGHEAFRLVIDSGAHSGCMSSDKIHLVKITDSNPNRRVKVANGALLQGGRYWRLNFDRFGRLQIRT